MTTEEWLELAAMLRRAAQIATPKDGVNVVELATKDWPFCFAREKRVAMVEFYLAAAGEIEMRFEILKPSAA